jgi:hypothetical protein
MKDTNYISIQGWMINQLKLSGNSLIVYAVIYGFSQDGVSKYAGSASYLAGCAGITKQAALGILKRLTDDGLLVKTTRTEDGVKFCDYRAVMPGEAPSSPPPVKKIDHPGKDSLPPPVKKIDHPGKDSLPHIDLDIKRDTKREKESGLISFDRNKPPEPALPGDKPPGDGPPDDRPIETKEDAIAIWNKAREFWNGKGLKPVCRDLMMRAGDAAEILRTFQFYSWAEIRNAIGNYAWHRFEAGNDFRPPPPYGSLAGFLKTGVEKYHDDDALDQQFKEAR